MDKLFWVLFGLLISIFVIAFYLDDGASFQPDTFSSTAPAPEPKFPTNMNCTVSSNQLNCNLK